MRESHQTRGQTALVTALFMLAARGTAFACLCDSSSPGMACGAVTSAAFVFEGTAQSVGAPTFFARGIPSIRQVRFSGVRHVRGEVTDVVFTGGGSCGYTFKPGERYLVVAGKDDRGRAFVSVCGLTRRASEAALLLQYLQTLDQGPDGGRVFGRLSGHTRSNAYGPIAGATITVEGPVSRSTITRADGTAVVATPCEDRRQLRAAPG